MAMRHRNVAAWWPHGQQAQPICRRALTFRSNKCLLIYLEINFIIQANCFVRQKINIFMIIMRKYDRCGWFVEEMDLSLLPIRHDCQVAWRLILSNNSIIYTNRLNLMIQWNHFILSMLSSFFFFVKQITFLDALNHLWLPLMWKWSIFHVNVVNIQVIDLPCECSYP